LLVAGGIGMPPIYGLSKLMASEGMDFRTVIGYRSEDDMFLIDRFKELGIDPVIATEDGSSGIKGLVTDAMDQLRTEGYDFDYVMCCGPEPMLKAVYERVYEKAGISGQMSFEERMGCGFGACMGCSTKTKNGNKRICKEGPVLRTEEIIW
jgi:dihydroorotate dehydrogenase electron transfer subunit